jgi:mono/diheme cytochrome c family protein
MALRTISHRHKILFGAAGAAALILIGVSAGFVILLSGGFTTAATVQHFRITHRLLDLGLRISVKTAARDIDTPSLIEDAMLRDGASCYVQHCAQCHGAPGDAPGAAARGLLPVPSPLVHAAFKWSPAELYYITKEGIRMTGMPAWGFRISERDLWSTVAFMQALPQLSPAQYRQASQDSMSYACGQNRESPTVTSRERGDVLLRQYACHSCHRIDGVVGPNVDVGPPLRAWSRQHYIAGVLPNTQANLIKWIANPRAVSPQTLMPDMAVPETHATEIATFLLTMQ